MPRNMSFMLTVDQVRNKTKTVTRRNGWWALKPGDVVNACVKCMGLKKGESVEVITQIRIVSTRKEKLYEITDEECVLEGFPNMSGDEFVVMFMKSHSGVGGRSIINRIEFEYLDDIFQAVARRWERAEKEFIDQVGEIAKIVRGWGFGSDIEEVDHATVCFSKICNSYECCEWLPFDLVPGWEDDLYCLMFDEERWLECREQGDCVFQLRKELEKSHG